MLLVFRLPVLLHKLLFHFLVVSAQSFFGEWKAFESGQVVRHSATSISAVGAIAVAVAVAFGAAQLLAVATR